MSETDRPTPEAARLRKALADLVNTLDEIVAHPAYQAVWGLAFALCMNYSGPDFEQELKRAKEVLREGQG